MNRIGIPEALQSLRPGAEWVVRGEETEWLDAKQSQPTDEEVQMEIVRLQYEYKNQEYARLREIAYPPMTDYLDAIVKGDQKQLDTYIAKCQAIKLKYPKP